MICALFTTTALRTLIRNSRKIINAANDDPKRQGTAVVKWPFRKGLARSASEDRVKISNMRASNTEAVFHYISKTEMEVKIWIGVQMFLTIFEMFGNLIDERESRGLLYLFSIETKINE